MRRGALALWLGTATAAPLAAQRGPDPLQGRVPPALAAQVEAIADSVSRAGLPGQPLLRKAVEGSAKGVPAARILVAVRAIAGQLDQSARALRSIGLTADSETVEAGAFAINAGLRPDEVAQIAQASRPPHQPGGSLRSAGTLVAMGVPGPEVVTLVRQWIKRGHSPRDVTELPAKVQAAMGPGRSPSQAAAGVAKDHPSPPPHPNGPPTTRPNQPEHPQRP
jgi:hypothetical protein